MCCVLNCVTQHISCCNEHYMYMSSSLGGIADLELVIRCKQIEDDIMVVRYFILMFMCVCIYIQV